MRNDNQHSEKARFLVYMASLEPEPYITFALGVDETGAEMQAGELGFHGTLRPQLINGAKGLRRPLILLTHPELSDAEILTYIETITTELRAKMARVEATPEPVMLDAKEQRSADLVKRIRETGEKIVTDAAGNDCADDVLRTLGEALKWWAETHDSGDIPF